MNHSINPSKKVFLSIFVTLLILLIAACKNNYEEVIAGNWEMTEYRINSYDESKEIRVTWKLDKNGRFSQQVNYPGKETSESGRWMLKEDDWLVITYDNQNVVEWKIIHLDKSSFKVEHTIPGFFVERSFKKK